MAETQVFDQVKSAGDAIRKPAYVNVFAPDYKPQPGATARGFQTAVKSAKAAAGGVAAIYGDVTNIDPIRQYGLGVAQKATAEAAELAMPVEQVDSVGSAVDFAKYAVGHTGGNLLTLLAGGALGRAGGAMLARGVQPAAEKLLLKNAGLVAGMAGSGIAQEAGAIYPDAVEMGVADPAARAIAGGAAAGALDFLPAALLAKRLGMFGDAATRAPKSIARGVATGAAVQAPLEAGTEVAQSMIGRTAAGKPLSGDEAFSEFLNSAAIGGVGGGVFGGVAGGVEAATTPAAQPAPAPVAQPAPAPVAQPAPAPVAQPAPAPVAQPTPFEVARPEDLGIVQEPERLALVDTGPAPTETEKQLSGVQNRIGALQAELAALEAEAALPAKERRPKELLTKARKQANVELATLAQRESNIRAIMDGPQYQEKTRLATPTIIGEQPAPVTPAKLITPEVDVRVKRATGVLLTAEELVDLRAIEAARQPVEPVAVSQGRTAETQAAMQEAGKPVPPKPAPPKGKTRLATPVVIGEKAQPDTTAAVAQIAKIKQDRGLLLSSDEVAAVRKATPKAEQPQLETVTTSSRGTVKQPTARTARDNFVNAYTAAVDKVVNDIAAQIDMKPGRVQSIKTSLKRAAERAVQEKDAESAQRVLDEGFAAAMKGKLPQQDVETFARQLSDATVAAAPEIVQRMFSKTATTGPADTIVFSHWGNIPGGVTDPNKIGTGVRGADWDPAKVVGLTYTSAVVKGSAYTEPDVQRNPEHTGVLQADRVYTARGDDPLLAEAKQEIMYQHGPNNAIALMQYAKKVRDLGYDAMLYPNGQLRIFTPQQVYRVPNQGAINAAAKHVASWHNDNEGSSYNIVTGQDMGGTKNYAVSPFKDREVVIEGAKVTPELMQKYIEANADLLSDPRNMVGTWFNQKDGRTYLDVSVATPSMESAITYAAANGQLAIFDLRSFTEIETGHQVFTSAQAYNAAAGFMPIHNTPYIQVNPELGSQIAMAYDGLQVRSEDQAVVQAYTAFAQEIEAQFEAASKVIKIEPWTAEGQPYADSAEMRADVFGNGHIFVFQGGEPHPFLTDEQNWKFRAIHDIYGHAKTGFEFGPRGELNATRAHAQMFSPAALPALVTETIGQNSWVNFSEANAGLPVEQRAFAEQKADLLPEALWRPLLEDGDKLRSAAAQRLENTMAYKGVKMLEALEAIVGTPSRLTAKIVETVDGGTGVIRFGQARDVIELSIRAKDGTSLAAHEGFHYLEQRVLNRDEKAVITRAFRRGAKPYNMLIERAKAYDKANGTDITSEIRASQREAHAYGYEFWQRGELQAEGALQRVLQKILQVAERIANMVRGYGFSSHEDIFRAVKTGAYARRDGNVLAEYAADPGSRGSTVMASVAADGTPSLVNKRTGATISVGDTVKTLNGLSVQVLGIDPVARTVTLSGYAGGLVREPGTIGATFSDGDSGTLFSQAATADSLADMAMRVQAGELPRTQLNMRIAEIFDDKTIPHDLKKKLFDGTADEFKSWGGSAKRFLAENIQSGQNLSRKSAGYRNVFGTLTSYVQRKNVLIADAVDRQLSTWVKGASKEDKTAVSAALLQRTENGWATSSPEYIELRARLNDRQREMFDQATDMINSRLDAELQAEIPAYRKMLDEQAFAEWYENRYAQVQQMKEQGYFPERRFGDHVVHGYVTTPDGKKVTAYFSQHEREADARRELDEVARTAGDQGLTFEYGYRYRAEYDGTISFGQFLTMADRVGVQLTQPEKERIGKALISADSTRRNRLFRRKNIAGYSQDGMRILAEFGVTMANKIAYSELGEAINDAVAGRKVDVSFNNRGEVQVDTLATVNVWDQDGPEAGFYRNIADETVGFVLSPREDSGLSSKMRGAATAHFLGGSIAAGMVNLSSLPMNTVPWLSQHTSYTDAMSKVLGAMKTSASNFKSITDLPTLLDTTKRLDGIDDVEGLRHALQVAAQDGTILDTEIYQIMGLSRGQEYSMAGNVQKAVQIWMTPFRLAEQMNRMTTFIAAYKVAKEKNLDNDAAYQMAQDTVYSTQFRYDDANRPAMARGDFMSILFVFKSYPIFVLETLSFLAKENPRAAAYMIGTLVMVAGIQGLPFMEDMQDLIDTIAQRVFGEPFNSQRWVRNMLKSASEAVVGADLSSVFMHGVANTLTELNFASRVGLGNLIPGTRIGAADADYKSVMTEIIGPVGSMVGGVLSGVDALNRGNFVEAARSALPLGAQNVVKGYQQWDSGFATDISGRKMVDVTGWEAFWQTFGMSSAAVSDAYFHDRIDRQTVAFYNKAKQAFQTDIVKAAQSGDSGAIRDAVEAIKMWNQTHPGMPISISASTIRQRVAQAGMTVNQRTLMNMPKELRGASEAALGMEDE